MQPSEGDFEPFSEDDSKNHGSRCQCTYVKVDGQQIDFGAAGPLLYVAVPTSVTTDFPLQFGAVSEPVCGPHLLSTPLYVWHCALII